MPASSLQVHLYRAFLDGRTHDVALHVRGSWEGVYKLHRVVLIQCGFFKALFDGGFREADLLKGNDGGKVEVRFDDPNITRAAFEVCIAKLYGGGPTLFLDPALVPTRKHQLTPSFPFPLSSPTPIPDGQQNATPRFLLSLVATAVYLSIPSVVTQATRLILSSVGPRTAMLYLNFAIGNGICVDDDEDFETRPAVGLENICYPMPPEEEPSWESQGGMSTSTISLPVHTAHRQGSDPSLIQKEEDPSSGPSSARSSTDYSDFSTALSCEDFLANLRSKNSRSAGRPGSSFCYGLVSDKIGEVVVCWLARWGVDMLEFEEEAEGQADASMPVKSGMFTLTRRHAAGCLPSSSTTNRALVPRIWRRGGLSTKWCRVLLGSDSLCVKSERDRYEMAKRVIELRDSSDSFTEAGESKYEETIEDSVEDEEDEEKEWTELFSNGIHYMHMTLDDLLALAHDIDPATGRPYIPVATLHGAHWDQALLRQLVRCGPATANSPSSSPPPLPSSPLAMNFENENQRSLTSLRDKELGLAISAVDIKNGYGRMRSPSKERLPRRKSREAGMLLSGRSAGERTPRRRSKDSSALLSAGGNRDERYMNNNSVRHYYPIPTDSSSRVGVIASDIDSVSAGIFGALDAGDDVTALTTRRTSGVPPNEANFFGLLGTPRLTATSSELGVTITNAGDDTTRYTPFAPLRFAVEFWAIDALKEASIHHASTTNANVKAPRLYSQTVWYAGSLFNVYIQMVRKKPPQQGQNQTPGSMPGHLGWQLGIYLHRQSSVDTLPYPSSPPQSLSAGDSPTTTAQLTQNNGLSFSTSGGGSSRPGTANSRMTATPPSPPPTSAGTSIGGSLQRPTSPSAPSPLQPYRDPRPAVRAYFAVECASVTGAARTRFASAPDVFSIGKSWGWKSGSLHWEGDEETVQLGVGAMDVGGAKEDEVSLRATVVIGMV